MAATAQAVAVAQPTEQQSLILMKNLLRVSICTISYLRNFFDESAYVDRQLEGINLKVLRRGSSEAADVLLDWLESGCFDALQRGYLRQLELGVYADPNEPHKLLERYTFRFAHARGRTEDSDDGDGQTTLDVYRNDTKIVTAQSKDEIRRATVRMFRTLLMLSESLDTLPERCYVSCRLSYFDELTPSDYNPPGFRDATDEPAPVFSAKSQAFKVGDVETPYHGINMRVRTELLRFDEQDLAADATPRMSCEDSQDCVDEDPACEPPFAKAAEPQQPATTEPEPMARDDDEDKTGDAKDTTPAAKEDMVACVCNIDEETSEMVKCTSCGSMQHAVCYAYIDGQADAHDHLCIECVDRDNPTKACAKLLSANDPRALAIWRSALYVVRGWSTPTITRAALSTSCHVDKEVAAALFKRMVSAGFLGAGTNKGYRINQGKLRSKEFDRYFGFKPTSGAAETVAAATRDEKALIDRTNQLSLTSDKPLQHSKPKAKAQTQTAAARNKRKLEEDDENSQANDGNMRKRAKRSAPTRNVAVH